MVLVRIMMILILVIKFKQEYDEKCGESMGEDGGGRDVGIRRV